MPLKSVDNEIADLQANGVLTSSTVAGAIKPSPIAGFTDSRTSTILAPVLRDFLSASDFKQAGDTDDTASINLAATAAITSGLRLLVAGPRVISGAGVTFVNPNANQSQIFMDLDAGGNGWWTWNGGNNATVVTAINIIRSTWLGLKITWGSQTNVIGIDLTAGSNPSFSNTDNDSFIGCHIALNQPGVARGWRTGMLSGQTNYAALNWYNCTVTTGYISYASSTGVIAWQSLGGNTLVLQWFGGGCSGCLHGFTDMADVVLLTSLLSTAGPITVVQVATLTSSIPAGAPVAITTPSGGTQTQEWTTSAPVTAGATLVPVVSQTPNFAYPIGSFVQLGYNSGDSKVFIGISASWNLNDFQFADNNTFTILGGRFEEGARFIDEQTGARGPVSSLSGSTDITVLGPTLAGYLPSDGIVFNRTNSGHLNVTSLAVYGGAMTAAMFTLSSLSTSNGVLRLTDSSIQGTAPFHTIVAGHWRVYYSGVSGTDAGDHPTTPSPDYTPPTTLVISAGSISTGQAISLAGTPDVLYTATLAASLTLTFSGMVAGQAITLRLTQDSTGSRVLTISPSPKTPGGSGIVLSTTANATDVVSLYSPDGTNLDAFVTGKAMA